MAYLPKVLSTPFPAVTDEIAAVSTDVQLPIFGSRDFSVVKPLAKWPSKLERLDLLFL